MTFLDFCSAFVQEASSGEVENFRSQAQFPRHLDTQHIRSPTVAGSFG